MKKPFPTDPGKFVAALKEFAKVEGKDELATILDSATPSFRSIRVDFNKERYSLDLAFRPALLTKANHLDRDATWATSKMGSFDHYDDAGLDCVTFWATVDDERTIVTESDETRIWKGPGLRLFLSHRSTIKVSTHALKHVFAAEGVRCFVAHDDCHPDTTWQRQIEKALDTCHALVALVTDEFAENGWCQQEIGWAKGRKVPVYVVRLEKHLPGGFCGEKQAIAQPGSHVIDGGMTKVAAEVREVFLRDPLCSVHYRESVVTAICKAGRFDEAIAASDFLSQITLTQLDADRLLSAIADNYQVRQARGVPERIREQITRCSLSIPKVPAARPSLAPKEDEYDPFGDE